ncbi:MAG TPA: SCO family protein [Burkholderiales bacterium]
MRMTPFRQLLAALVAAGLSAPALAHDRSHRHDAQGAQAAARPAGVELTLPDTRLTDQDGRAVRLKSDVLAGRVAVVSFVYTTCTTVCPVLSATMSQLQQRLGARLGEKALLVSITVDPQRDTPARLKEYSAQHGAGADWRWLTGSKGDVDAVLKAFGTFTPNPEDHPAITMIGDAEGRRWTRLFGFPSVEEVLSQVEHALAVPVARHRH